MRRLIIGGLAAVLLVAQSVHAAELRVVGAPDVLAENIRSHIGELPDVDGPLDRRDRQRLIEQAVEAAAAVGYYNPQFSVVEEQSGDTRIVRLSVDPGERVIFQDVRLAVTGAGGDDPEFRKLLETLPLEQGAPLHHGEYESAKRAIQTLALRRGYFEGEFTASRVEVDAVDNIARAELVYDTGPRYRIGEVRFSEVPLRDEFLQRLIPFEGGAPYEASRIAELNRRLLESRYFESVRVRPLQEETVDGRVPIAVELTMAEPNRVGIGLGYATDTGPRARVTWTKPWLNRRGHSLAVDLEVSEVRQSVSGRYRIPLRDPLEDALELQSGYLQENINDTESEVLTASIQRQQRLGSGWVRATYLRLEREQFIVGEEGVTASELRERTTTLVLPGLSFSRTRSRGGIDPAWGDRQSFIVEATDEALGSDVGLVRARVGSRWVRSHERNRFFFRLDGGAIETPDLDEVPVSLRFFAGGDQSVRGFDLNTLAPRNGDGDIIGGLYLLTASAEYAYAFRPRWRAAAFVDAGNAFNSLDEPFKIGAGIGLHWVSPVGPVRIELAWPIDTGELQDRDPSLPTFESFSRPDIHFSLGPRI